jgi:hypothetical protein
MGAVTAAIGMAATWGGVEAPVISYFFIFFAEHR